MRYFKALLLTEGAHGMVSQAEGLAKALKLDFNHCFVNLKKPSITGKTCFNII